MPMYEFRCERTGADHEVVMSVSRAPRIGQRIDCECDGFSRPHQMRRVVQKVSMAEVKGTGNGPIGRGLEERAELGRKRRAGWD